MLITSIVGLVSGIALASAVGLWAARGASTQAGNASAGRVERRRPQEKTENEKNRASDEANTNRGNPAAMKLAEGDAAKNEFANHAR